MRLPEFLRGSLIACQKNARQHVEKTMPTINQLVRKGRKDKKTKTKAPALQYTLNAYSQTRTRRRKGAPQKRGVCTRRPRVFAWGKGHGAGGHGAGGME